MIEGPKGQVAPPFSLPSSHGEQIELAAFTGRPVVLFFFPYAFTGVCTGELRDLAGRYQAIIEAGAALLAVSTDTRYALRVFAEQEQLPFTLLSDFWPHGATAQRYGCFDAGRGCAERASFVLDVGHRIHWQARSELSTPRSVEEMLAVLGGTEPA